MKVSNAVTLPVSAYDAQHVRLDVADRVATITQTTYDEHTVPMTGSATHCSLRFKAKKRPSSNGPAILSSVVIHHDMDDDAD